MGHILRSNQTQLYKYLLYFIYFQISQNENQNLYMISFFLIYLKESKLLDKQFILLKHIIIYGFTISLSTISNYEMVFYFFLSFQVQKNNMLLIAIVSLQYILLQYSLCSICLDNLQVIDIYIYISSCNKEKGLAKTSTHELWSCKNNVIRTTHAHTIRQNI